MSLFGKILEKLGLNRPAQAEPVPQVPPAPQAAPPRLLRHRSPSSMSWRSWRNSRPRTPKAQLEGLDRGSAEAAGSREQLCRAEGACGRTRVPAREDGRLGTDEHVVAQDRAAEARRQRRQHSEGTARLTDAVVPRVAPAWPSAGPPSAASSGRCRPLWWVRCLSRRRSIGRRALPARRCQPRRHHRCGQAAETFSAAHDRRIGMARGARLCRHRVTTVQLWLRPQPLRGGPRRSEVLYGSSKNWPRSDINCCNEPEG